MRVPRGTVCLITDGARLRPSGTAAERHAALVQQAAAAGAAGIEFIQIRERHLAARDLLALTADIVAAAGRDTRVLVNDRLDVALAAGAAGVHLRSQSMAPADARAIARDGFVIACAVHTVEEVRRAASPGAADLAVFGAVFQTQSKPAGHTPAGIPLLRAAAACGIPVLAIGGINASTVREVAATAAAGIAAIGWFLTTDAGRLADAVAMVRETFDSTQPVI